MAASPKIKSVSTDLAYVFPLDLDNIDANDFDSLSVPFHVFQEYEETCLFIIARFSTSESLRVYPNILKLPPIR